MIFSDILLAVDYDRTLTAPDSTIPRRNIRAIEYFIENGGAFTVNTGRSVPMARAFIGKVPLSAPLLLYNGSAAYDAEKQVFTQTYEIDLDGDAFVTHLEQLFPDLLVEIQGVDAHYALKQNRDWELFGDNGGCAWGYGLPSRIPGPFLKVALYGDCSGHTVASMYDATPAELARIHSAMDTLEELYGDNLEILHPCAKIVDIHAKGTSKLRAARDLQKAMGKQWLVCVGDAENDVSMLEGADFAYCPADGVVADRFENVCPCADCAVADVIYSKLPLIAENNP